MSQSYKNYLGGTPQSSKNYLGGSQQATKRKAFFSFHYDADIMRVNNVRNAWKITHPDSPTNRSFYDSSLWEERKLTDEEQIKSVIRAGVEYTSVVCVLVGTDTWNRRWVKYEIARSVVDGKGLLAVHINGLKHHQRLQPDSRGHNPIHMMGLAADKNDNVFLCEQTWDTQAQQWKWSWYGDYTRQVRVPDYMPRPAREAGPLVLSQFTREYDFAQQNGHTDIGGWIDTAAADTGR